MVEGRVLGIVFLAVGVLGIVVAVSSRPLYRVEPRRAPNPVLVGVLLGGGMTAFVILLFLFGR
jgi:NADPH-dependent curcumin reductase CurA